MKITTLAVMAMATTAAGRAGDPGITRAEHTVTVCMEGSAGVAGSLAKALTSKMFADIGVTIRWHLGFKDCPLQSIMISLNYNTPANLNPDSLAYALPNEGTHIRIFYDRISRIVAPDLFPHLLAHVMAHEISHILEGICRHSNSGVMKAHWEKPDFDSMTEKALPFADEDVRLIILGLARRASQITLEIPRTQ